MAVSTIQTDISAKRREVTVVYVVDWFVNFLIINKNMERSYTIKAKTFSSNDHIDYFGYLQVCV